MQYPAERQYKVLQKYLQKELNFIIKFLLGEKAKTYRMCTPGMKWWFYGKFERF